MTDRRAGNQDVGGPDDKMEFADLYIGLARAAAYHIIRLCFNLLRTIIWLLNGTLLEHWNSYKPENYNNSAHIYNVVGRYKFDLILGQASFEDFLLTHDKFVHPMYLLQDECVLYQVTRTHAIFVQVADGVDIWRSKYGSFLRQAQFQHAKKIITLPLYAMEKLSEDLGPNPAKLVFIQNTARCGSTLLVRMFEQTGRCVAFCEPDAVNGICKLARTKRIWDNETGNRVVRNLVRLQCKPVARLKEPLAYILKMTAPSMEAAPFVLNTFPEASHMFMYRDCVKISQSLAVAAEVMPVMKLVYLAGSISSKGSQFAVSQMGTSSNDFQHKLTGHPLEPGVFLYTTTVKKYLQMVRQGMKIKGVRYEDLTENPQYFMSQILRYCKLPLHLADSALEATTNDAQSNSPLSMSNLKTKKKSYRMSPAVDALRMKLLTELNVSCDPAPVLINTMTHRKNDEQASVNSTDVGGVTASLAEPKSEGTSKSVEDEMPVPSVVPESVLEGEKLVAEAKEKDTSFARDTQSAGEISQTESGKMTIDDILNVSRSNPTQMTKSIKVMKDEEQTTKPKPQLFKTNTAPGQDSVGEMAGKYNFMEVPHIRKPSAPKTTKVKLVGTLTKSAVKKEETVTIESRNEIQIDTNKSFEFIEAPTEDNNDSAGGSNVIEPVVAPNFLRFDM